MLNVLRFIRAAYAVFSIYCVCLLVMSCSHRSDDCNSVKTYTFDNLEKGSIQDIFEDVELTEIKFEGEDYPRSIKTLLMDSDRIILFDSKVIYIYSSDGRLVSSSLSKRGNGPGEFGAPLGFSWNPYSKQIEVLTPMNMMFFDENFNFIRASKLNTQFKSEEHPKPLFYNEIFDLSDHLHILNPTGSSESPYRLMIYDSLSGEVVDEVAYGDEDVITNFNQQPLTFFRLPDDKIMFHPRCVTPYTYEYDEATRSLNKRIKVEAGEREISKADIKAHEGDLFRYVLTCDRYIPMSTLVSSDRLLARFKQSDNNVDEFVVAFSNDKPEGLRFDMCNADRKSTFPVLYLIDENYTYGLNISHYIKDQPEIVLGDPVKKRQLEAMDEESWILLKYKFKD